MLNQLIELAMGITDPYVVLCKIKLVGSMERKKIRKEGVRRAKC